jgi:ubiquinone/menaquinone biosynthesis C-methylase UbiE
MTLDKSGPEYVLGASASEQERLERQASAFDPLTERIFRHAGIQPGMRVLDVGCGAGDVSLLVQRLVGRDGSVLGVDREAASLERAQSRATRMRIKNVSFLESDFRYLDPKHGVFDAVVGRLVLMFQADPADAVRLVAQRVRPGGVLAFHELAATTGMAHPALPLREQWLAG